jgi:(R,R)-butanediol dehydrogenase/meso-butanediol dehydrogenase/diacetyl reductase
VVVGVGGIGAFIVHAAAAQSAQVLAIDIDESRLLLAASLGAHATVLSSAERDLTSILGDLDRPADAIFEVTGNPNILRQALAALTPGARLVLVGIQKGEASLALGRIPVLEHDIVGTSAHVCAADLPRALELIATRHDGWSDVAPVVRPLSELLTHGLAPLSAGHSLAIKTLYDPSIPTSRAADYGAPPSDR